MALKLENGTYALGSGGLPEEVSGLQELLQDARLRLTLPRGTFPYGRDLGSGLWDLDPQEERGLDRALALANEALLDLPGVLATAVTRQSTGSLRFTLETPFGEGEVDYGKL